MSKKSPNEPKGPRTVMVPMVQHDNYYYVHGLGCAAALVTAGFELMFLDKENRRQLHFVFRQSDEIADAAVQYFQKNLPLDAHTLNLNAEFLRKQMYDE